MHRRALAGLVALVLCWPATTAAAETWRPAVQAAHAYAAKQEGSVSFAVRTPRHLYGFRARRRTRSASVVKAMLMVTYLNHPRVRRGQLTRADLALITPMIRRSDNSSATKVHNFVGNAALRRLARRVGMRNFATSPSWGATQITPADQARFFLNIETYVVRRHRGTALRLLGSIVQSQRWGLARARPRGWMLYFKSGWRSGIENQVGLLRRGNRRVGVAVFTSGLGSAQGRTVEREVARRLLRGLDRDAVPH